MQIFYNLFDRITDQPTVLTLGMFDGVHLGHQKLIRSLINFARSKKYMAGLITFFPHPKRVLGHGRPLYLTSNQEKLTLFEQLGLDLVVIQEFTVEFAQTQADRFVDLMVENLCMKGLWIGHDFALGYRREGNVACLSALGVAKGFTVHSIPEPVILNGQNISSSRIREALRSGDMNQVNNCLGRPFRVFGKIMSYHCCQINCRTYLAYGICQPVCAVPKNGLYSARVMVNQMKFDTSVRFGTKDYSIDSSINFEVAIPEYIVIADGTRIVIEMKASNPFVHQKLQRITDERKNTLV